MKLEDALEEDLRKLPEIARGIRVVVKRLLEKEREAALRTLPHWKPYPETTPDEYAGLSNSEDIILLNKDGTVTLNVFYTKEDSAHDHSCWQRATHWMFVEGFDELPKEALKKRGET